MVLEGCRRATPSENKVFSVFFAVERNSAKANLSLTHAVASLKMDVHVPGFEKKRSFSTAFGSGDTPSIPILVNEKPLKL